MTLCTDTGDRVTLRGKRKKRMRQQTKRHTAMEMNTYSFLGKKKQKLLASNRIVLLNHTIRTFLFTCVAYVRLGFSLTSLHGITATSRSLSPDETFLNNVGLTTK